MVKICSIGAASQDVFISGKGIRAQLDPQTNEYVEEFKLGAKLNVESVTFASGGGATNAAVTFARQGIDSTFIGKIGNDVPAHGVLSELDAEHVNTGLVRYHESLGTQYSTILVADSGERTILIYRGAANAHQPADYEDVDFEQYDWLYVSSLAGAFDALDTIFERAHEAGVKIAFNPGEAELSDPERLRGLLGDVEVLLVNKEEAAKIVDGQSSEELARHALNYVPTVVVSDGPNGVVATDGKTVIEAGMYDDVPVRDRTGAGDAFGSGFVSQVAQGKSLKEAIIYASANSTSVVQFIGAKQGILHSGTVLHDMPLTEKEF